MSSSSAFLLPMAAWRRMRLAWLALATILLLSACGSITPPAEQRPPSARGNEVVLFAMGMMDTGYRFGGKNPEAGFDCSGMVSYIFREAVGVHVSGSAADIAKRGREVNPRSLRAGDLVFFNTMNRSFSHVGIYIGDGRFVHAPSTNGRVRIDRMDNRYFAQRFEMARSYFD
ncbi:C40 family peptidase [uncultured Oxalicibacterium sp.]|uniref:C40 family peptidase n=1 Tax=uncultured Oxalicibacterium sp. TaxID=1168540 RepID=UPI0025DAE528|nr:C40 family peptidase [uncultured Oxalicibacterium sp.]